MWVSCELLEGKCGTQIEACAQNDVAPGSFQPLFVLVIEVLLEILYLCDSCVSEITHGTRWHAACVYDVLMSVLFQTPFMYFVCFVRLSPRVCGHCVYS